MSDGEFIVKFIATSSKDGKTALDAAKEEIKQIDLKLQEAENLKLRRMKLVSVLNHLGDDSYKRRRNCIPQNDVEMKNYSKTQDDICDEIKKVLTNKGPLFIRELMSSFENAYDKDVQIITAIKQLGERDIISRDDSGRIQLIK